MSCPRAYFFVMMGITSSRVARLGFAAMPLEDEADTPTHRSLRFLMMFEVSGTIYVRERLWIFDDIWNLACHCQSFFLSENHGRIFLALINLWFSSQRPEPQWISARNDDAVDMTSPMIGRSLDEHFTKSVSLWCRKSIAFQWISWTNKNNSRCLFSEADPFLVTWDRPTPGASQERQRGSGGPNWNCPFLGMDHDGSPSKAWCWVTMGHRFSLRFPKS